MRFGGGEWIPLGVHTSTWEQHAGQQRVPLCSSCRVGEGSFPCELQDLADKTQSD